MGFPARYPGTCSRCNKPVKAGSEITWSRKDKGKIYHVDCNKVEPMSYDKPVIIETPQVTPPLQGATMDAVIVDEADVDKKPTRSLTQNFCNYCKMSFNGQQKIKTFANQNGLHVPYHNYCMDTLLKEQAKKIKTTEKPMNNQNNAFGAFVEALTPMVQERLKSTLDENAVKKIVNEAIENAGIVKPLEIKNLDSGDITKIDKPHKDLKTLLYFISKRQHVYLHGPAGSGKSTAALHVAEALKLEFGYISLNPQTPDSRILGFVDAGGTYRETAFYKCYKNGGVFCIDEMDNASASLLTTLNSMLENGHGAFPNGIVPRHKDFVLVATGNTNGRGGNPMFPERRPFDAAFAERFTFLFWDYDGTLEKAVALSINPNAQSWINYTRKLREFCAKNYPRILVSPRATFKGAEYIKDSKMTVAEIAEAVIFKGLDQETIRRIASAVPYPEIKTEAVVS